ncbi:glycoside hydrolase superfamily [Hyaloraphidium curvatum]|nr:glycoside hydrolase superfamily [Hyaloraphidium curvatum]
MPRLILIALAAFFHIVLPSDALKLASPPAGVLIGSPSGLADAADALASSGLLAAGYDYVVLGGPWAEDERDKDGVLVVKGGVDLAKEVERAKSKGVKVGLVANGGSRGCSGGAGSLGHEATDAARFASWGIDYLLYTSCNAAGEPIARHRAMGEALNTTGNSILFGIWDDGTYRAQEWASALAHTWSTSPAPSDPPFFSEPEVPISQRFFRNVKKFLRIAIKWARLEGYVADWDEEWRAYIAGERGIGWLWGRQAKLVNSSGPGLGWNDMGPLRFAGLGKEEARSEVVMWMLLKSPLIVGDDVKGLDGDVLRMLKHPDLLELNRGPGKQIDVLQRRQKAEVWTRQVEGGAIVVLVNKDLLPATLGFDFSIIPGLPINATFRLTSLVGPDAAPEEFGYYRFRYVTEERGIRPRQVLVLRLIRADPSDVDVVKEPGMPRSRKEIAAERGKKIKDAKIKKAREAREGGAKPAEPAKNEL